MGVSCAPTVLIICFMLSTQALDQQPPLAGRSKRDPMASMISFFSNVERRLVALETSRDNSTEERVAEMEGKMQERLQDMEEKLQGMQDGMQRLESIVNVLAEKMAEMVEAKANATEDSAASLEATKAKPQSSSATCQYKYQYQFEKESPCSSGEQQRIDRMQSELTRLQEKMSALDKRLQDNFSVDSLHNTSVLAMEGVVRSVTELVAASEENFKSSVLNATKFLYESSKTMLNDTKAQLLARSENNVAVFNASIARVEQSTKELATQVSVLEDKLDNATSLLTEELENARARCEDVQTRTENNRSTEVNDAERYRRTCQDYYDHGQRCSGIYKLLLEGEQTPMEVYCDMSNGTGWVVFQRRQDGSVDFYRNWTSYEDGFGDLSGEFWLGHGNIISLNRAGLTHLRVDLQAWDGSTAFASYSHFSVGDTTIYYTLSVSGYSGTAEDGLGHSNGRKFSTYDMENDDDIGNCAQEWKGAWWYGACANSNLNGEYGTSDSSGWQYVWWGYRRGQQSLQRTELKLK